MGDVGLNAGRDEWFDVLCAQVLTLAGRSADLVAGYAPVPTRSDLGVATIVAWVCQRASRAMMSVDIAERLLASGALPGHDLGSMVAAVRHIRLKWIRNGLPIADWWDADQLLDTLLAYLAPRIASVHRDEAARQLRSVFGMTNETYIEKLVDGPLNPRELPPDVSDLPRDQPPTARGGVNLLLDLAARARVRAGISDIRSRSLLGGAGARRLDRWQQKVPDATDRWLQEGQALCFSWWGLRELVVALSADSDHAARLNRGLAGVDADSLAEAMSIANKAWQECNAWQNALTAAERTLIREQDDQELRRRRWLDGYMHITHVPRVMPDSVPDVATPGAKPPIPAWVSSYVFERGARFMHKPAGPLCLWFGVMESDQEERNLALALNSPGRMGITDEGQSVVLDLPVEPGDIREAALAPFRFSPDHLNSAVELILVALVGARVDWYRLHDDRELEHLDVQPIAFPPEALDALLDRADAALERAEIDKPNVSPRDHLIFGLLPTDQEQLMFVGVDNAKSESILLDLALTDTASNPMAQAVAAARAELAAAELARVSADADGVPSDRLRSAAEDARHMYHLRRQQAHRTVGRTFNGVVTNVVTADRAFVQFAEMEDYLSALIAFDSDDGPQARFVDLSNVTVNQARQISDIWLSQAVRRTWEHAAEALDIVLSWAGRELVAPVVDGLHDLDLRHIILCPSRVLEPIPLHAAPASSNALLGDVFDVSYAPSASIVSQLSVTRAAPRTLDLVVAASGAEAPAEVGLRKIPGPEQEARLLHVLSPHARVLSGSHARPDKVLSAIAASQVAHLAAHGRPCPDSVASGLWLAGGTPAQSLLSAARVHAGPTLRNTSLVVLSACATAQHPTSGQAVQAWRGLDSAFLSRGARAAVASLWEVADVAALVYGAALHVALAQDATIARAHSAATRLLRGGTVDPQAAALLNSVRPSWSSELGAYSIERAYWWSVYRPSGICW